MAGLTQESHDRNPQSDSAVEGPVGLVRVGLQVAPKEGPPNALALEFEGQKGPSASGVVETGGGGVFV